MKSRYIKWDRLDNTANLFPVIAGESLTNTYRISATLTEEIDPELLQQALDIVTPKIPGFNLRLRHGVFWYYFEENGKKAPKVIEEHTYPCRFIQSTRNRSYLFRVTYYERRINLEVFHVLTDGMGGITFLRELVYQYLRLAHPELKEKLGDSLFMKTAASGQEINEATAPGITRSEIRQGYIENSNVQVADEMVNLIIAQRAYEMNSKIIQASDTMMEEANNLRR